MQIANPVVGDAQRQQVTRPTPEAVGEAETTEGAALESSMTKREVMKWNHLQQFLKERNHKIVESEEKRKAEEESILRQREEEASRRAQETEFGTFIGQFEQRELICRVWFNPYRDVASGSPTQCPFSLCCLHSLFLIVCIPYHGPQAPSDVACRAVRGAARDDHCPEQCTRLARAITG